MLIVKQNGFMLNGFMLMKATSYLNAVLDHEVCKGAIYASHAEALMVGVCNAKERFCAPDESNIPQSNVSTWTLRSPGP
jgi:hypothetical protein